MKSNLSVLYSLYQVILLVWYWLMQIKNNTNQVTQTMDPLVSKTFHFIKSGFQHFFSSCKAYGSLLCGMAIKEGSSFEMLF